MLGVAQALSATGSSLLVVLDDASDKAQYSKFWDDLTGLSSTPGDVTLMVEAAANETIQAEVTI